MTRIVSYVEQLCAIDSVLPRDMVQDGNGDNEMVYLTNWLKIWQSVDNKSKLFSYAMIY